MSVDLGHGRGWLASPAAASVRRIDRQIGHPLQITEAGRTWAKQKKHWDTYQRYGYPIALHPDTPSIHQLGAAIDTDERITAVLNDHGWYHTVYRDGKLVEPWHYEYFSDRDNHRNDSTPAASSTPPAAADPITEEDDMPVIITNEKKTEFSLLDPDIGLDLPRFKGDGKDKFRTEKVSGGVVNVYNGMMVTTSKAVGAAWGRSYCRAYGNAPLQRLGSDYKNAQIEASRLATEKHRV